MAQIDPDIVAIVAIASAALSLVLSVVVVVLALRLRSVRRTQRRVFGRREVDVIELLSQQRMQLDQVAGEAERLRATTDELRELVRGTVSRMAVVRYDAFDDMGGALSFSAALLDEHGHGVVISAINGRSETRAYAKGVTAGHSEHSLTHEETDAIEAALAGRSATPVAAGGRRRRRRAS